MESLWDFRKNLSTLARSPKYLGYPNGHDRRWTHLRCPDRRQDFTQTVRTTKKADTIFDPSITPDDPLFKCEHLAHSSTHAHEIWNVISTRIITTIWE